MRKWHKFKRRLISHSFSNFTDDLSLCYNVSVTTICDILVIEVPLKFDYRIVLWEMQFIFYQEEHYAVLCSYITTASALAKVTAAQTKNTYITTKENLNIMNGVFFIFFKECANV